jgi:hypothetical protein
MSHDKNKLDQLIVTKPRALGCCSITKRRKVLAVTAFIFFVLSVPCFFPLNTVAANPTDSSSEVVIDSSSLQWGGSIANDSKGNLYLIYYLDGEICYANNKNGYWQKVVLEYTQNQLRKGTSIVVSPQGDVHLVYVTYPESSFPMLCHAIYPIEGWGGMTGATGPNPDRTSIALDHSGKLHIACVDSGGLHYGISTFEDGWARQDLDSSAVGNCSLALDENDYAHIVYLKPTLDGISLAYLTDTSGYWETNIIYQGEEVGEASLIFDVDHNPNVLFTTTNSSSGVSTLRQLSWGSGLWEGTTIEEVGQPIIGVDLALRSDSQPVMSYYSSIYGGVRFAMHKNASWETSTISHSAIHHYTTLAFNATGDAVICTGGAGYLETSSDQLPIEPMQMVSQRTFQIPVPLSWTYGLDYSIGGQTFDIIAFGPSFDNITTNLLVSSGINWDLRHNQSLLLSTVDAAIQALASRGVNASIYQSPSITSQGDFTRLDYALFEQVISTAVQRIAVLVSETTGRFWQTIITCSLSNYTQMEPTFEAISYGLKVTKNDRMVLDLTYYTKSGSGFGIPVPRGWDTIEDLKMLNQTIPLTVLGPIQSGFRTNIVVMSEHNSSASEAPSSLEAMGYSYIDALYNTGAQISLWDSPVATSVSGHGAVIFAIHWVSPVDMIQKTMLLVDSGNQTVWSVTCSAATSAYDDYSPTFSEVLEGMWLTTNAVLYPDGWALERPVGEGKAWSQTRLCIDDAEVSHLAYFDYASNELIYANNSGGAWRHETVSMVSNSSMSLGLAVDKTGRAHIVFSDPLYGTLFYANNSGGSWSLTPVDHGYFVEYPSVAVAQDDSVYIVYMEHGSEPFEPGELRLATMQGGTWAVQTLDAIEMYRYGTSIAFDAQGHLHIAYSAEDGGLVHASNSLGTWTAEVVDSGSECGIYSSLAIDANGTVHVSYVDHYSSLIKYAVLRNYTWSIETVGQGESFTSIALDNRGNPCIAYSGSTESLLCYAVRGDPGWDISSSIADFHNTLGASLSLDSQDRPHISFIDTDNQTIGLVIKGSSPSAPIGLNATKHQGWTDLVWSEPSDNGGLTNNWYVIYRSVDNGVMEPLNTSYACSYNDSDVAVGHLYHYRVAMANIFEADVLGNQAEIFYAFPPSSPIGLMATGANHSVVLTWTMPVSNGGSALEHYVVYRGEVGSQMQPISEVAQGTTYLDDGLTNGHEYQYSVTAVNAIGESSHSILVAAVPADAPSMPLNFTCSVGNEGIWIHWQPPSSDGGSSITGYNIYRGTTNGSFIKIATLANASAYLDSNVSKGQSYYYRVIAVNQVGEGQPSTIHQVMIANSDESWMLFAIALAVAVIIVVVFAYTRARRRK